MARPIDADSRETYERIVSAARELILGSAEPDLTVSMRSIAKHAGVSSGTLSYYFASKDDLLEACLDSYYDRLGALTQELIAEASGSGQGPIEFVGEAARRLYRFAREEKVEIGLRVATNSQRGELHPQRQRHVLGPFVGQAGQALAALSGLSEEQARLTVQTMIYIITRYALSSDDELNEVLGEVSDDWQRSVEDHVAQCAVRLVGITNNT